MVHNSQLRRNNFPLGPKRMNMRERLKFYLNRTLSITWKLLDNVYFWGVLGWLLIALRYSSDLVLPRYGG